MNILKKIIDRIKQNKRHSFKNPPEKAVKKNTTKNTDAMENKAMVNLVQVAQKSALDLQSVMEYRLTEVPLSLFHLNRTMKQKSKLLDCFSFNVPHEVGNHVSIIDMGLLRRISLPSKKDRETYDGSHFTWKDYAEKLFLKIMGRQICCWSNQKGYGTYARYILVEVNTCSPKQIWEFHLLIILMHFL